MLEVRFLRETYSVITNNDISDINKSFCGDKNNKLLYNLLSFKKFYENIINKGIQSVNNDIGFKKVIRESWNLKD